MVDIEPVTLLVSIAIPLLSGAAFCAAQYKAKALANGEAFSTGKFYLTEAVAVVIGLVTYVQTGGVISTTDMLNQLVLMGGYIVLLESSLKIVYRWLAQSPFFVHALGGVPTEKADTVAAVNTPAAAGGILVVADTVATVADQVMKMPEANFRWMCFGQTNEEILSLKNQVMAAEKAGLTNYYVTWNKAGLQFGYFILNGEVYGSGENLKNADPGIVPAPGATILPALGFTDAVVPTTVTPA